MAQNFNLGSLGQFLTVNSATNTAIFANVISVGNSTVNVSINSTSISSNVKFAGANNYFSGKSTFAANLVINTGVSLIDSAGSQGSLNQVLTSNGSGNVYWSTFTATVGSYVVNTSAAFNLSGNITFSGNTVINGTNNVFGTMYTVGAGPGAIGNSVSANVTTILIGNSTVYSTVNSSLYTGTANNANNLGGTAASSYALLAGPTFTGTVTTGNVVTIGTAAYHVSNGNFGIANSTPADKLAVAGTSYFNGNAIFNSVAAFYNINGQANIQAGAFVSNAYATLGGSGGAYLAFGQQTSSAQWIQSGYSSAGAPVYYSILLNPLGGNIGIGNSSPSDRLSVNGTTYFQGNTTITGNSSVANIYSTGTINAASYTVGSSFIANTNRVTISGIPLSANSSNGISGYVLTSNGDVGSPYWSVVTAADTTVVNTSGNFTIAGNLNFTATNTYFTTNIYVKSQLVVDALGDVVFTNGSGIQANGVWGDAGQALTSDGSGNMYWSYITGSGGGGSWVGGTMANSVLFSNSVGTTGNLYVNSAISLGGVFGDPGQVLTSNGTSNAYWSTITGGAGGAASNATSAVFTADGSTTNFTLPISIANLNNVIVTLNGLVQAPTTHYIISGSTLAFTSAPYNTTLVEARSFEGAAGSVGSGGSSSISSGDLFLGAMLLGGM